MLEAGQRVAQQSGCRPVGRDSPLQLGCDTLAPRQDGLYGAYVLGDHFDFARGFGLCKSLLRPLALGVDNVICRRPDCALVACEAKMAVHGLHLRRRYASWHAPHAYSLGKARLQRDVVHERLLSLSVSVFTGKREGAAYAQAGSWLERTEKFTDRGKEDQNKH